MLCNVHLDPVYLGLDQRPRAHHLLLYHPGWLVKNLRRAGATFIIRIVTRRQLICRYLGDLLQDPRRITGYHDIRRNILGYDTTSPDSASATDSHPRKYDAIPTKPAVLANGNWCSVIRALEAIPDPAICRMTARVEGTVWTDQGPRSHAYETRINPCGVRVYVYVLSEPQKIDKPTISYTPMEDGTYLTLYP